MRATEIDIRPAGQADLEAINRVIEAAVMTWHLPDRVKRLSLPAYRYDSVDLDHLDIVLAEDGRQNIIGIAAWEQADDKELSEAQGHAYAQHCMEAEPRARSTKVPKGVWSRLSGRFA